MRNVVVTGGGTGIGYAIAGSFVAAGDRVVITGRRKDVLADAVERLGPDASALPFDATDPRAVAQAARQLPRTIDVLVNNAGGNTDFRPLAGDPVAADVADELAMIAAQWRANLDANLISAVLVTTAVAARLTEGARVITIGSIAARTGAGSYGAAKAAVEAWTASLAADLGPRGITANVVSPGLTLDTEFFGDRLTEARKQHLIAATLTKRPGGPADVAATVLFLASTEARHLTGQVLHVNGGAYLGR